MRKGLLGCVVASLMLVGVSAVSAQDGVMLDGLDNPRHLAVDGSTGTLYIAQAGTGGDLEVQGAYGPALGGSTSLITVINADGSAATPITGLPSRNEGGEIQGASGVTVADGLLWVAIAQGTRQNPLSYSVVALEIDNDYRIRHHIDVWSAENGSNPDGGEVESNPVDVAFHDGTAYIADASANVVWQWTESDGISVFASWSTDDNPVPAAVEVAPDGLYVGFLTGFPFPPQGSRVEKYGFDGTLLETYDGLSTVVDLLFANDTLYAVELGQFGDQGWTPNSGRVVDVFSGEVYAEGLNLPYGLVMTDMGLMVSVNSAYGESGSGAVMSLSGDMSGMGGMDSGSGAEEPASTPEAGS